MLASIWGKPGESGGMEMSGTCNDPLTLLLSSFFHVCGSFGDFWEPLLAPNELLENARGCDLLSGDLSETPADDTIAGSTVISGVGVASGCFSSPVASAIFVSRAVSITLGFSAGTGFSVAEFWSSSHSSTSFMNDLTLGSAVVILTDSLNASLPALDDLPDISTWELELDRLLFRLCTPLD